jgi:putative methyltransferase (TIGR04325 family)
MSGSLFKKARIMQVRIFSRLLKIVCQTHIGARPVVAWRNSKLFGPLLRFLLAYQRRFASYGEAKECAARYIVVGHEHPDNLRMHFEFSGLIRESDYAPLFYMAPNAGRFRKVFDFGGSVGNLFYAYKQELEFADDLKWVVYDLPEQLEMGRKVVQERREPRLSFTDKLADAAGADLFILSGSLHYFEKSLAEIVRDLPGLPPRVLVNRTPISRGDDMFTVQDNKTFMVPCTVHGREKLIQGMKELGYTLRASWPIYERQLWVPDYPDLSNNHYSGFYFERDGE